MSIHNEAENIQAKLKERELVTVRIALFGQPGAGKSSLINRITGQKLAPEGVKTDQTIEERPYDWQGLHLVDLPGYGTQRFPKENFLEIFEISKFDVFLCVYEGKFRAEDSQFFHQFVSAGKICLFVRNKAESIYEDGKTLDQLQEELQADLESHVKSAGPIFYTSCRTLLGIDNLSQAIVNCLDSAKRDRYLRGAKAYSEEFLDAKKKACEQYVAIAAGASAANALNPIPGVDIAVDISILVGLFQGLRSAFGLTDERINAKDLAVPSLVPLVKNVAAYLTREGILLLLKQFVGRIAAKEAAKWVPLVGTAIAASIGFGITHTAGHAYLNDCYALAKVILEHELGNQRAARWL